jgi:DNA-binding NtrC family response regulator
VGSTKTLTADVRLIAATNKRLEDLVRAGTFREDLYYRLKVVRIELPPLRARRADIPLLAQAFMRESASENDKPVREITPDAMERLINYHWPGNVRELRSAIETAVVLCRSEKIGVRDLPPELRSLDPNIPFGSSAQVIAQGDITVKEAEKQLIVRALKEAEGSRTEAAKKLGMSRRTLHRKLHAYHLEGF